MYDTILRKNNFMSYICNEILSVRNETLHLFLQNLILNSPESLKYETEPMWCTPKKKLNDRGQWNRTKTGIKISLCYTPHVVPVPYPLLR